MHIYAHSSKAHWTTTTDLWSKRMHTENIILSKDGHCYRHWLIVNKNTRNHN